MHGLGMHLGAWMAREGEASDYLVSGDVQGHRPVGGGGQTPRASGGRVGWNSVATQNPTVAQVFGFKEHPDHEDRYERADEFIDIVSALFAREDFIREVSHSGKYFNVRGNLPFTRSRQGAR
jgi:alkanesulfonate monooxygenase SsuD/methylene tetrahydromethanopterin reductase-like flavin-dependent oxidoreductase (luciferase family)